MTSHWATLSVALRPSAVERAVWARQADQMNDLATMLAMEPGVTGVQTRDPTNAPVERVELVVYTDPPHLDAVAKRAGTLAEALGLDVVLRGEEREDEDWHDAWKAHYRPLVFGDGDLLLRPSWIERQPDHPPIEIVLDPGRAFGTGLHESTALCLDRLCALRRGRPQVARLLDLGCGSGILALAGLRLWGETIIDARAVDIDPEAVETAEENAALNGLSTRLVCMTGTLEDLGPDPFDLIVANIRPEVLIPIAEPLRSLAAPGADVILSGILAEEGDNVSRAFEAAGWIPGGPRRHRGEWVGLDFGAP